MTDEELLEVASGAWRRVPYSSYTTPRDLDIARVRAVLEVFRREQVARDEALRKAANNLIDAYLTGDRLIGYLNALRTVLGRPPGRGAPAPATEEVE